MSGEGFSIDMSDPDARRYFQLAVCKGRLNIEIQTGLRSRVSTLGAVEALAGRKFRRKDQALTWVKEEMDLLMKKRRGEEAAE